MEAGQRVHRDPLGTRRLDDLATQIARRGGHRDQHLVGPVVADQMAELVGRAEHPDPVDAEVPLARVVVDEADRGVGEPRVALHLADDELAGIAGADDEHALAAGDDSALRPLDQRAREQPRAGDEREQQQEVESDDPLGKGRGVVRRNRVEHEVGEQTGRRDALDSPPHVLRGDVSPPAVVEAEDDEDAELDPDHGGEDAAREEVAGSRPGRSG